MQTESSSGRPRKARAVRTLTIAAAVACLLLLLLVPVRCGQPTSSEAVEARPSAPVADSESKPADNRTVGQVVTDEVREIHALFTLIGFAGGASSGPSATLPASTLNNTPTPTPVGTPPNSPNSPQISQNPSAPGTPQAANPKPGDGPIRLALPL